MFFVVVVSRNLYSESTCSIKKRWGALRKRCVLPVLFIFLPYMRKRIFIAFVALGVVLTALPLLVAFEAHVINVTAQIESRLLLDPIPDLDFGTTFPQEKLDKTFVVSLAGTFLGDPTLDDLEYILRQKPKCVSNTDPTYHPPVREDEAGNFFCPAGSVMMPLLCPYLSKKELTADGLENENDGPEIKPFHGLPGVWNLAKTIAYETHGRLVESGKDLEDEWNIDLKVPCFEGQCAQDWSSFIFTESASTTINPFDYDLDPVFESQTFGCDLWLEVTATSAPPVTCTDQLDLMLVLDTSGSIDSGEMTALKNAAVAFVNSLAPTADGIHIGVGRFSTTGTLIQHLSGVEADIEAAINGLPALGAGLTNLEDAILDAQNELDNGHEHERPAIPDVMVIITDGAPTADNGVGTPADRAAAQADSAKAASIEIFAVGVGIAPINATYLKDEIVSPLPDDHYADASDFSGIQTALENLAICEND